MMEFMLTPRRPGRGARPLLPADAIALHQHDGSFFMEFPINVPGNSWSDRLRGVRAPAAIDPLHVAITSCSVPTNVPIRTVFDRLVR